MGCVSWVVGKHPHRLIGISSCLWFLHPSTMYLWITGRTDKSTKVFSKVFDHKPGFGRMCERYFVEEALGARLFLYGFPQALFVEPNACKAMQCSAQQLSCPLLFGNLFVCPDWDWKASFFDGRRPGRWTWVLCHHVWQAGGQQSEVRSVAHHGTASPLKFPKKPRNLMNSASASSRKRELSCILAGSYLVT